MQRYVTVAVLAAFFFLPVRAAAQTAAQMAPPAVFQSDKPVPPVVPVSTGAPGQPPTSPMGAQLAVKVEDLSLAAAIAELSQDDPEAAAGVYQPLAQAYMQRQTPDKAISLLETYRRGGGASRQLLSMLATLYLNRGAPKEAITAYEALVRLYPSDADAAAMLSSLYAQHGSAAKGAELMEAAARSRPDSADSYVRLSDFYHKGGELVKAEQAINRAISLGPRPEYYRELAQLLSQQAKTDRAISTLEEAIVKWPEAEADLTMAMSGIYAQHDQKAKAVARLKALLAKTQDIFRKEELQRNITFFEQGPDDQPAVPLGPPPAPPVH